MRPSARPEARAFALGLAGIALVTLWRVALLPFDRADLFTDDAQYWFWGRQLAWGYYSKPPLIAWILRLSTAIGGDGAFWIRLPLPLMHAGTAVIVALIGRRLFDARTGALAGLAFVSLPAVALGSLLVSTDTPMLFCFACAMLAHLRLAARPAIGWALALGAAVGVGLLAKYAMIYFLVSALLATLVLRRARIGWRDAGIAACVALAVVTPNLLWNATNSFSTLRHTADNAGEAGAGLNLAGLLEFWGGQFAVAGPVLFGAYMIGLPRARRGGALGYLALMSLPALMIVSVQAARSGANANWGAAAHVAAAVLAIVVLRDRRRWLLAAFAINLAVTVALPVATIFADTLRLGSGELLLARYVGRADVSLRAAEIAREQGLDTLVSGDRSALADFFYTLRDSGLAIYAEPTQGFPPHHYAQKHPLPPGDGEVLFLTRTPGGRICADAAMKPVEVARWRPTEGYSSGDFYAFRTPRACWFGARP